MEVPFELLAPDTLRHLVETFVTREGTDYGAQEQSLDTKIEQVLRQLRRREAVIVFDADSETCNIVSTR